MDLLRFFTAGSVDDGKSTLIGRLLLDTKFVLDDQLEGMQDPDDKHSIHLASLTDGLRAEKEQGITIDVAYRYFHTANRKFIIADAPGHAQYTRNMVTAASSCTASILLLDVNKGLTQQGKLHLLLIDLLKIPYLIVCINKIDTVGFSENAFNDVTQTTQNFLNGMSFEHIWFVPTSALLGDNIVHKSPNINWYHGEPILKIIEEVPSTSVNSTELLFPVQHVSYLQRDNSVERLIYGECIQGSLELHQSVIFFPSGRISKIKNLYNNFSEVASIKQGEYATITIDDEIDIGRGELISEAWHELHCEDVLHAIICWLDESSADTTNTYILRLGAAERKVSFVNCSQKMDTNTGNWIDEDGSISMNEIVRATFQLSEKIYKLRFSENKNLGSAILVDPVNGRTVAAVIITS